MKRGEARPLSYSNVCIYMDVPLCVCTCRSSMKATALCRSLRVGSVWSTVGSRSCLIPKLQHHARPDVNDPDHQSLSIRLSICAAPSVEALGPRILVAHVHHARDPHVMQMLHVAQDGQRRGAQNHSLCTYDKCIC